VEQTHKLSDMISALRDFSTPPMVNRQKVDMSELVMRVTQRYSAHARSEIAINTLLPNDLPPVWLDPKHIGRALGELVRNAVEAKGVTHIEVRVQTGHPDGRLRVQVTDDGPGMSDHVLAHALEPFFSAKPAGRQPGLGLARARRATEAHHGHIELANNPNGGTTATLVIPDWRGDQHGQRHVA
jgi:signal transduction histidine kinase